MSFGDPLTLHGSLLFLTRWPLDTIDCRLPHNIFIWHKNAKLDNVYLYLFEMKIKSS